MLIFSKDWADTAGIIRVISLDSSAALAGGCPRFWVQAAPGCQVLCVSFLACLVHVRLQAVVAFAPNGRILAHCYSAELCSTANCLSKPASLQFSHSWYLVWATDFFLGSTSRSAGLWWPQDDHIILTNHLTWSVCFPVQTVSCKAFFRFRLQSFVHDCTIMMGVLPPVSSIRWWLVPSTYSLVGHFKKWLILSHKTGGVLPTWNEIGVTALVWNG